MGSKKTFRSARPALVALALAALIPALSPPTAAFPPDAFAFFTPALPTPAVLFLVPAAPNLVVGPFFINGVTGESVTTPGVFKGAGNCAPPANAGEVCVFFPAFNPFVPGPTTVFDCQITGVAGPWVLFGLLPAIHLAQDVDGNGIIENTIFGADIIAGPIGFAYGNPPGVIPAAPPAGAVGSSGFVGAPPGPVPVTPFLPGLPIHIIAEHTGVPLGPWSPLLSMAVTCIVF